MHIVLLVFFNSRRTGSHQGHVPFEHVEKLGQFVDASLPEEVADGNDPRVIVHLEHQAGHFILRHEFLFAFFRVRIHRPELVNFKGSSVSTDTFLSKKDRTGRLMLDNRSKNNQSDTCKNQANQSANDIGQAFDDQFPLRNGAHARRHDAEAA